jgi:ATP-dependent protease ClpP protease subunit
MKRFSVLALLLFAFLISPQPVGVRTASAAAPQYADPADPHHAVLADPDIFKLFEALDKKEPPKVVCESKDGSDKCVPQYRFSTQVDEDSVKDAQAWIKAANDAGASEILFELNTPGGSVPDGFELAKAIENSDAPVTCVVDGDAASMGAYLLEACDQRVMTRRSKVMFHEPALSGQMSGQPNQWQAIADMLKAEREIVAEHCAHRLSISLKQYREKTDGGQMWWLTHEEALKVHAVDSITKSVKALHRQMLQRATPPKAE